MKDLTAEDLLVSSDLSESSSEEKLSTGEPELVADQLTVAAAAHNLINPYAWTPIATGPRQPVPPKHRNLKPPPKRKQPVCRSARTRITQPKNRVKNQKTKENKTKGFFPPLFSPLYL